MDALRGIGLLLRTPRLWPLCFGPLAGAIAAYVALGVAGYYLLLPRLLDWLNADGRWGTFAGVAAAVVWLLLFPFAFTLIAGALSGLIFEPLSRAVERLAPEPHPTTPESPLSWGATLGDSVARLALNAALGVAALLLGLFLGPIPGVLAAALIGLLDYTSPAFLRRARTLGPQSRTLLTHPDSAVLSFAVVAGLLSLVPLVGVLLLPGLVAGGTLLARRRL